MFDHRLDYGTIRILDIEVFPNFFLICLDNPVRAFQSVDQLRQELENGPQTTLVTYKGSGFDFPMLRYAEHETDPAKLKAYANKLVSEDGFYDQWELPEHVKHVDVMAVCPPFTSLKLLAARIGGTSIQDLPYPHDTVLTPEQKLVVAKYCLHDLEETRRIWNDRKKAIDLREWWQKNLADSQIAERTLVPVKPRGKVVVPTSVEVFGRTFRIEHGNGSPIDPGLPDQVIDGVTYQVGLGGLHSVDLPGVVDLRDNPWVSILLADVASYYPSMLLGPLSGVLSEEQEATYRSIKERRLHAKHTGDKDLDDMLKIVLNGAFGKLGNKYSRIYNPKAMLSVTLLGQINLLKLIRHMTGFVDGLMVLSANTDGVDVILPNESILEFKEVCTAWQRDTGMTLEYEEATFVARRDVNNYFMLTPYSKKNKVKTKGVFEPASIKKSPAFEIIYEAVMAHFGIDRSGEIAPVPLGDYITQAAADPTRWGKFLSVRTVNGGAVVDPVFEELDDWVLQEPRLWVNGMGKKARRVSRPPPYHVFRGGARVGRVIRWYIGHGGANVYTPTGGRVPLTDDGVLVQDLRHFESTLQTKPFRVDWYVAKAQELLDDMLKG